MIRHASQAELYGLTPAQRTNGAATINATLDGENVSDVTTRLVDANKTIHGQVALFVEADFSSAGAGGRLFDSARTWASTRSTDAADGRHSYVRLKSVDDVARSITTRYAESPAWTESTTVTSLDSALKQ